MYRRVRSSRFAKHIAVLIAGTAAANAFGLLIAPILTRLFTPDNFGVLALFSALSSFGARAATLSYDQAIVIAEDDREADSLAALALSLLLVVSLTMLPLLWFFNESIASTFKSPGIAPWLLIIPFVVLMRGWLFTLSFYIARLRKFSISSSATVIESISGGLTKILLGFAVGAWSGGLIVGMIVGVAIATGYAFREINKFQPAGILHGLDSQSVRAAGVKFRDFPLFNSWTVLLNELTGSVTIILFSVFFGPTVLGLFSLASRIVRLPTTYFGNAFQRVYYPKAADDAREGRSLSQSMLKGTAVLGLICIGPFLVVFAFGEGIFGVIFGSDWTAAGRYAEILAPGFFFVILNKPAYAIYMVLRKLKIRVIYTFVYTAARVVAICIGYFVYKDPIMSLWLYSLTMIAFNIYFIVQAYYFCNRIAAESSS